MRVLAEVGLSISALERSVQAAKVEIFILSDGVWSNSRDQDTAILVGLEAPD